MWATFQQDSKGIEEEFFKRRAPTNKYFTYQWGRTRYKPLLRTLAQKLFIKSRRIIIVKIVFVNLKRLLLSQRWTDLRKFKSGRFEKNRKMWVFGTQKKNPKERENSKAGHPRINLKIMVIYPCGVLHVTNLSLEPVTCHFCCSSWEQFRNNQHNIAVLSTMSTHHQKKKWTNITTTTKWNQSNLTTKWLTFLLTKKHSRSPSSCWYYW